MATLHHICPQFIEEGRLCWLRSPLYIVKNGKEEKYYFTDEDFEEAKNKGEIKGEVNRAKGLGSLSPEQAHNSMFIDKNQKLDLLTPTLESIELLEQLMGEDVEPRKDFIFTEIDFNEIRE